MKQCILCDEDLSTPKSAGNFFVYTLPGFGDAHAKCYQKFQEIQAEAERVVTQKYIDETRACLKQSA